MKYFIPEFILFILIILFTPEYVEICNRIFIFLHYSTEIDFFKTSQFLAFPFLTIFIFFLTGFSRLFKIEKNKNSTWKDFIKNNSIYLIFLCAFGLKVYEALMESEKISLLWPLELTNLSLFFFLIGAFCSSSIFSHLAFQIITTFKRNSK